MLRLSKETDYGILLLRRLQLVRRDSVMSARDLAEASRLPLPTVGRILKALARAGILTSRRGAKCRYALGRRGDEITVATVVEALQGPIAMTSCHPDGDGDCRMAGTCPVAFPIRTLTSAVRAALEGLTLAQLFPRQSTQPHRGEPEEEPEQEAT